MSSAGYSDYIVYIDESGDHDLTSIKGDYPVFVLAFCIFPKEAYAAVACPALQRLKFKYYGHDTVVFHERDIRKADGPFKQLFDRKVRDAFMADLSSLIEQAPFTIVAVAIHKERHIQQYARPEHPYNLALKFGLERVQKYMLGNGQKGKATHFIFEKRGRREDDELELEFRRIDSAMKLGFSCEFADKRSNACGLQIADLVARPIGQHVLRPDQPNRTWSILEPKIRRSDSGKIEGYGLKIFP